MDTSQCSSHQSPIVITACVADVAVSLVAGRSATSAGAAVQHDGRSRPWAPEGLAAMVERAVGERLERSFMTAFASSDSNYSCKRRSSSWMCRSIERLLSESRLLNAGRHTPI